MFNRRFATLTSLSLAAYFSAITVASADVKQGVITGIEGTRIVVTMPTELMAFNASSSTLISLNGQPAKVSELRVGDAAVVMFVIQDDNSPIPQRIDAMRPTAPGVPDPVPYR